MTSQVQSVQRAFQLLELIAQADQALGISTLAEQSRLPVGTVHRLLSTLTDLGYVEQDTSNRKYTLGLRFLHLRGLQIRRLNMAEQAMPLMKALMRRVNETVHLAVLDEGEIVYIDRVEGLQTLDMYTVIGKRTFAHCTALGKAMLAFMPDTVWRQVVERHGLPRCTANTITDVAEFAAELRRTRERGYAIDNAEVDERVRCVAAPIYDFNQQVIAAASISGPSTRITPDRDRELGAMICRTCEQISMSLGYLGKP